MIARESEWERHSQFLRHFHCLPLLHEFEWFFELDVWPVGDLVESREWVEEASWFVTESVVYHVTEPNLVTSKLLRISESRHSHQHLEPANVLSFRVRGRAGGEGAEVIGISKASFNQSDVSEIKDGFNARLLSLLPKGSAIIEAQSNRLPSFLMSEESEGGALYSTRYRDQNFAPCRQWLHLPHKFPFQHDAFLALHMSSGLSWTPISKTSSRVRLENGEMTFAPKTFIALFIRRRNLGVAS